MEQFKQIFHLSHTDLDGYGAQLISGYAFGRRVKFFNANYGEEISFRLQQIIRELLHTNSALVLITDLGLSFSEAAFLDSAIKKLQSRGNNIEVLLFDHHISAFEVSLKYEWFSVDESRCATQIVYDTFLELGWLKNEPEWLLEFVETVDAVDRWDSSSKKFEMGRVWNYMVDNLKEINRISFEEESRNYILSMMKNIAIKSKGFSPIAVDELLYRYKKLYFKREIDDTLENLVVDFSVDLLSENIERMSFYYKDLKGLLGYEIEFAPAVGNKFLETYADFDFFVNLKSSGEFFICSIDQIDVSKIAKAWAIGAGHKNAAFGKIDHLGEIFDYKEVQKLFLDQIFAKK
jgi:oligoribonuclease NrnB/cAMP/cGMP phosphodiesterase (DHH superfamily)